MLPGQLAKIVAEKDLVAPYAEVLIANLNFYDYPPSSSLGGKINILVRNDERIIVKVKYDFW